MDEPTIEIGKSEEGLYVLDFPGFGPILYDFNFVLCHLETIGTEDITEVFNGLLMEFTLVRTSVKTIRAEATQDLADMLAVEFRRIREDENIIEINDDTDIQHIFEDIIHETLKSRRSVG
jgi:hypothetical protein